MATNIKDEELEGDSDDDKITTDAATPSSSSKKNKKKKSKAKKAAAAAAEAENTLAATTEKVCDLAWDDSAALVEVPAAAAVVASAVVVVETAPTVVETAPTVVETAPTVVETAPTFAVEAAPTVVVETAPTIVVEAAPTVVVETAPVVVETAPTVVVETAPAFDVETAPVFDVVIEATSSIVEKCTRGCACGDSCKCGSDCKCELANVEVATPTVDASTWTVHLTRISGQGLGIKIKTDVENCFVIVTEVIPNSIAAATSMISANDYILKVNDFVVPGHAHAEVVASLSSNELDIVFTKTKPCSPKCGTPPAPAVVVTVVAPTVVVPTPATAVEVVIPVVAATAHVAVEAVATPAATPSKKEAAEAAKKEKAEKDAAIKKEKADRDAAAKKEKADKEAATKAAKDSAAALKKASIVSVAASPTKTVVEPVAVAANASTLSKTVLLVGGPNGLGMKIRSEDTIPYVRVSELIPGGAAEQCGEIFVNDILVEINQNCMRHASHDEVVKVLRSRPDITLLIVKPADLKEYELIGKTAEAVAELEAHPELVLAAQAATEDKQAGSISRKFSARLSFFGSKKDKAKVDLTTSKAVEELIAQKVAIPTHVRAHTPTSAHRVVHLNKGDPPVTLGLRIAVDDEKTIPYVYEMSPEGLASKSGLIFIGDNIVSVNGKLTSTMTCEQVALLMKSSTDVELCLELPVRAVNLKKTVANSTWGMKIKSDEDSLDIMILDVVDGGLAKLSGAVFPKDVILSVNGKRNLTHEAMVTELKNSSEIFLSLTSHEHSTHLAVANAKKLVDSDAAIEQALAVAAKDKVQSELVQSANVAEVIKAADAEQLLRTTSVEFSTPPAAVSDAKASMQEQLLAVSSLVKSKDAEEEERTRRVQENKMHDVSQQLQQEASARAVDAAMDAEKAERVKAENDACISEKLVRDNAAIAADLAADKEQSAKIAVPVVPSDAVAIAKSAVQAEITAARVEDAVVEVNVPATKENVIVAGKINLDLGTTKLITISRGVVNGLQCKLGMTLYDRNDATKIGRVMFVETFGPAYSSGVQKNYTILELNGESIVGKTQLEILTAIKSSQGDISFLFFVKDARSFCC